jgi:hypothetical protein
MKRRSAVALAVALEWAMQAGAAPRLPEAQPASELPGKPTGPITVEYRLAAQPAVGVPLTIKVTARVESDVGTLGIEANATSPRSVLVTPPQLATARDGNYVWELTVVPLVAEAGYLSVIVSGASEGVAQAGSVTISLRSAAAPAETPLSAAANGEALISLPVQENP